MIDERCKKLFKKWILWEAIKDNRVIITYSIPYVISLTKYFRRNQKEAIHDTLFDLYFDYEYVDGQQISARKISYLLGVHHSKIDIILNKFKNNVKNIDKVEKNLANF